MKWVDEFRDPQACRRLVQRIRDRATRPWTIMEVCGGQTHGLLRYGIDQQLSGSVELIHGPGCPVCVTPLEAIDLAIDLALRPGVAVASFGDMLRVPGSRSSLLQARTSGGDVRMVYSPLDAVRIARRHPDLDVVFFAVGFETTAPATALAVQQAHHLGLRNFWLFSAHVRVQPAMELLAASQDCAVDGFLAAGHVCAVTGYESYHDFVKRFRLPVVVTGFEPVDLLAGILACVEQLERGEARVENRYERGVSTAGNPHAWRIVDEVYQACDRRWRGFGMIPTGGLRLRGEWAHYDAELRFGDVPPRLSPDLPDTCRGGEVLSGRIKPPECEHFGTRCTPGSPLGAPMVSTEGACAAYYRYHAPRMPADHDVPVVQDGPGQSSDR
jgi:hydrogenase expression/formation protein HypD